MTVQHLIAQARRTSLDVASGANTERTSVSAVVFTLNACADDLAKLAAKLAPADDEECPVCRRLPCVRLTDCAFSLVDEGARNG